jgi:glycosyltransferase involved in cell wall biosynthesis
MKFSIITPEHDPGNIPFLMELYESLRNQTYKNWEWILYINNKFTYQHVPQPIAADSRVKVCQSEDDNKNVGALKNRAFNLGSGDVLVEADHDDILTPDCLEELYKAYQDPEVGFVYSDNAVLQTNSEFIPYDKSYGWTYRTYNYKGKELIAMNSFEPSSHSLGYIWYAPDHVRSWRKEVYKQAGGHNPDLPICDDHELCIKTYLITKMKRVPKVLYIYRITGDNTWLARNEAIQIKTKELFNQHVRALAEKDARDQNLFCVDIGGGLNAVPNYMTIDLREEADIQFDLNNGIPLPDHSVGVLNASHILEHLHDKTKIMAEIHRVLAPGGWAFIEVPSTDGRGAFQDPTHVSYWNENSFLYYTNSYLANFIDNTSIRFQEYRRETWFPNDWLKSLNVCVTTAWLVAVKEGMPRLPGPLNI